MNENNLVDLVQLIDFQTREQYRTILILGSAGSGKTKFAQLLANRTKAKYIDLLDAFSNDKRLSENIDTFDVSHLKKYLLNLPVKEEVIIVDNIDFLLNTWSDKEIGEFLNLVEKLRSNETQKTFCFFAQDLKISDSKQIYNSQNNSRILTMNKIAHIKEEDTQ
jgi:DNA replication protein DnaC